MGYTFISMFLAYRILYNQSIMDKASQVLAHGVPPGVPKSYRALADHGDVPRSTLHHRARGRRSIEEEARTVPRSVGRGYRRQIFAVNVRPWTTTTNVVYSFDSLGDHAKSTRKAAVLRGAQVN